MLVFQMYSDQARMSIDIFVRYPLDFDELWDPGTKIEFPGTSLRIASIDHLNLMKRKASRPQDLLLTRSSLHRITISSSTTLNPNMITALAIDRRSGSAKNIRL
jgi:hypothetical protein